MLSHLGRALLLLLLLALTPLMPVRAQDASVYPLPADLYILTSEQRVLRIDATTGEQTAISPEGQPVGAFDIAPGGGWYAYRTLDTNAVIVAALNTQSGFVVEFDQPLPVGASGRGIAWAPDAAHLAYTVPDGVRIVDLAGAGMGELPATTVQGGPWGEVAWLDSSTLIVSGGAGTQARIGASAGRWAVEAGTAADAPPAPVEADLTPEGVRLADGRVIPGTAGTLAFDWGPLPLPALPAGMLPAALYFLAADANGVAQVWTLGPGDGSARAITASTAPILDYAVRAGRVAAVTPSALRVSRLDGSADQPLAALSAERVRPTVAFNDAGSRLAFSDDRGLWTAPADGSQPPRLIVQNVLSDDPATVRVYHQPRWRSDDAQLLVTIGLYEGSLLGVVDLASGAVTELPGSFASLGQWTVDGRVASRSASVGYSTPGLYLLDPAAPDATPVTLLGPDTPVFDAAQAADGSWIVVAGSSSVMGPQWMRLLTGSESRAFARAYGDQAGAALEAPKLAPPAANAPALVAGLRRVSYGPDGTWGQPVIADLSTGEVWMVPAPGSVSQMTWGP